MPFDSVTTRSDVQPLIREQLSKYLLGAIPERSAVMSLARRLPNMGSAQTRMPVLSALSTAYFKNPSDSGLGNTTEVSWDNKYIDAEDIMAIMPIAKNVIADSSFDVWEEVKPELATAIATLIDAAVIYGTNIPATWAANLGTTTTSYNGLVARATAASQIVAWSGFTDIYEALNGETAPAAADGVLMLLEANGYMATGAIAHTSFRGALRGCRDSNGNPIFRALPLEGEFPTDDVGGVLVLYPMEGVLASATCKAIYGQWNELVYSIRQEMTLEVSDQAVLTDAQGAVTRNLWQQDEVALKVHMRLGFALPNRINRTNQTELTRCAFSVLTD